jgi:general secretion pathway protein K
MTPATPDRERGAAVVLAMLLAALASAVAAGVFADQQRWSRTVEHRRDQVQAQALVQAGVQWGRQILYEDKQRSSIDHLREPWAMALPAIPLDNGEVRGSIADAQARLNVIALGDSGARANVERARLQRLFVQRGGPVGAIDAIAAWVSRNTTAAGGQPLRVAELADVKDVSPSSLANVAPFLTALPAGTPVNVNTAPPEVLAAVVDKLDGQDLAKLVAARAQKPFLNVSEFRAQLPQPALLAGDETLGVQSDYFYVTIEARQGASVARARALLRRRGGDWPDVVWQVVE